MNEITPFTEPFILIGQPMGDGVVLLVGEPVGDVHLRERVSTKSAPVVDLDTRLKPGYTKIRAATYQEAVAIWLIGQAGPAQPTLDG